MRTALARLIAVPAAAAAVVLGVSVMPASADPDPVTSGTTTIDISLRAVTDAAAQGIVAVSTKPGTLSYDPASKSVEYAFPVTGGDGSIATFYGDIKHSGGLVLVNSRSHRSVTLTNLTFTVQDDTISATPAGTTKPVVLFDALGQHDASIASPSETFTASDVQIDPAGASYLNRALKTHLFGSGQSIGTFATTFTNSND